MSFYEGLKSEVKKKFNWTLQLIATLERIPEKYFKHITGSTGLYDVRVEVGSEIYRVFSFFDKRKLVMPVNGFQKKTQKTPKQEIELVFQELKIMFRTFDAHENNSSWFGRTFKLEHNTLKTHYHKRWCTNKI